jgi:hypothetical protein
VIHVITIAAGLLLAFTQVFTVHASAAVFVAGLLLAFVGLLRLGDALATRQEVERDVGSRD